MKPPIDIIDTAIQYIHKAEAEGVYWNIAAGPNGPPSIVKALRDLRQAVHNDRIAIDAAWKILVDGYDTNDTLLYRFIDKADSKQYE